MEKTSEQIKSTYTTWIMKSQNGDIRLLNVQVMSVFYFDNSFVIEFSTGTLADHWYVISIK